VKLRRTAAEGRIEAPVRLQKEGEEFTQLVAVSIALELGANFWHSLHLTAGPLACVLSQAALSPELLPVPN
jgi:hypothetical protein